MTGLYESITALTTIVYCISRAFNFRLSVFSIDYYSLLLSSGISSSRWVGRGLIDAMGMVKVSASVLFPAAPKHITLCLMGNLAIFVWLMNGSNMSSYLEVPRDWPVRVYRVLEAGQEVPNSWAEAEGLGVFAVARTAPPRKCLCSSETSPFPSTACS